MIRLVHGAITLVLLNAVSIGGLATCKSSKLALLEEDFTIVINLSILIPPRMSGSDNAIYIFRFGTVTCTFVVVSGTEELLYSGTYNFDDSLDGYLHSSKPYILGSLEASIPEWRLAPYSLASSAVTYNYPYYFVSRLNGIEEAGSL